jgi:hypothetical protein
MHATQLFALLHWLGITQQAVAEHLGVARSTVALWARKTDPRPIPKRHARPLVTFVATVAEHALEKGHVSKLDLMDRIERWFHERVVTTGRLEQMYRDDAQTLQAVLHLSPQKLDETQRQAVITACQGIVHFLRVLNHLHQSIDEELLSHTKHKYVWGFSSLLGPRERLMQIALYSGDEVEP